MINLSTGSKKTIYGLILFEFSSVYRYIYDNWVICIHTGGRNDIQCYTICIYACFMYLQSIPWGHRNQYFLALFSKFVNMSLFIYFCLSWSFSRHSIWAEYKRVYDLYIHKIYYGLIGRYIDVFKLVYLFLTKLLCWNVMIP